MVSAFKTAFLAMVKAQPRLIFAFILIGTQCSHAADKIELRRGAAFFMNYCAGCHSLRYMRPDHVTGYQYPMQISMPETDARQWFGRMPPDLSLTARERGPVWLYTYLTSFYPDHSRPFGANNTLVPDVAMPNVLAALNDQSKLDGDLHDVVSFLIYVAEPARMIRYQTGLVVMAFLAILGLFVYRLKCLFFMRLTKEHEERLISFCQSKQSSSN